MASQTLTISGKVLGSRRLEDRLNFYKRDEWKPIPLADIPPRIFSEVIRELGLVNEVWIGIIE